MPQDYRPGPRDFEAEAFMDLERQARESDNRLSLRGIYLQPYLQSPERERSRVEREMPPGTTVMGLSGYVDQAEQSNEDLIRGYGNQFALVNHLSQAILGRRGQARGGDSTRMHELAHVGLGRFVQDPATREAIGITRQAWGGEGMRAPMHLAIYTMDYANAQTETDRVNSRQQLERILGRSVSREEVLSAAEQMKTRLETSEYYSDNALSSERAANISQRAQERQ